ncbi:MAG: serine/threonine-protein phosphatase [Anaerolineales bacterium]|nr:serine/threonine-protein phosphatase [Anaerolineales bacterium]
MVKNIIKSIFGNNQNEPEEIAPVVVEQIEFEPQLLPQVHQSHQLNVGYYQSVGKQREHNEDALFTLTTAINSGEGILEFGLYIVADGMGGHQHGEIASEVAIRSLAGYVTRKVFTPLFNPRPSQPQDSLQEIMREGMQEAHRTILRSAPGGGTTMTSLLLLGDQMTIAHVGDSRAYTILNDGNLQCLTRDHSLVNRLIELGQLTIDEAANHPQRNVLYRALGLGEPFEPDIQTIHLVQNKYLILCSDGLWGVIPESTMTKIIHESDDPSHACQQLVDAANEAGGPDNISVILVMLPK